MPVEEEELLRSVALQNQRSILAARQRAEHELLRTKEELEQRTKELAHSLAMMSATLESTRDGVLVVSNQGEITTFNQKWAELWRIPPELLQTRDQRQLLEVMAAQLDDAAAFAAGVEQIQRGASAQTFDVLRLSDGRTYERTTKLQMVEGRSVGRVWLVRDISVQERAGEALRDEGQVLELLNRTGSIIAASLDLTTLVQAVTDATTQLSGAKFGAFFYPVKDELGETTRRYALSGAPREVFDSFGYPRATSLFGPTFRGEEVVRCDDVTKDPRYGQLAPHHGMPLGHPVVRSYLAVPVVSRTGEPLGGLFLGHPAASVFDARTERIVIGVAAQAGVALDNARLYDDASRTARERTRLLEAEQAARLEVERVSVMKDEFLATLSHELRTPLNAILGWSQILSARELSPDVKRGIDVIARNARAQTQLVEDLLDMNRIISGNVRLDVQQTNLIVVVQAALDSARPSIDAKEIRLRAVLDPLAGPVAGDPNRLQQVIWNLLSNAVKFTPRAGSINVLLERVGSHLEITITDSGLGIAAEFLPHVFERFRQADSSSTRRFGGLGLGLSIAKHLVELHGGNIRVTSAGEGKGASFTVFLPLAPVRESARAEHPTQATQPAERGELDLSAVRVLVVDDEADARELVKAVLEQSGATVLLAGGAREALQLVQSWLPDVLLSDIGMPEMDGYQLMHELRRLPAAAGGRTPAIALTAFARSEDRMRALRAGYQIHVAKPIEPQELVVTVGSVARTSKEERPSRP